VPPGRGRENVTTQENVTTHAEGTIRAARSVRTPESETTPGSGRILEAAVTRENAPGPGPLAARGHRKNAADPEAGREAEAAVVADPLPAAAQEVATAAEAGAMTATEEEEDVEVVVVDDTELAGPPEPTPPDASGPTAVPTATRGPSCSSETWPLKRTRPRWTKSSRDTAACLMSTSQGPNALTTNDEARVSRSSRLTIPTTQPRL